MVMMTTKHNKMKDDLGVRIKESRKSLGVSRQEFAVMDRYKNRYKTGDVTDNTSRLLSEPSEIF